MIEGVVAYFSMEIALESRIPTYSGGLGVLAGDTLRAAADLGVPMVGVTLLHRQGSFAQRLAADGTQSEEPVAWPIADRLEPSEGTCSVQVDGHDVTVRAWRYVIRGVTGATIPVFLLDTDVPGNAPDDRRLTDRLYGGDARYRLRQEVILGAGGVRMLRALGYARVARYHIQRPPDAPGIRRPRLPGPGPPEIRRLKRGSANTRRDGMSGLSGSSARRLAWRGL